MPLYCDYTGAEPVFENDAEAKCWTGKHIIIVVISSINTILHIIFLIIIEILFNDTSPHSNIP
jgi:hypothetical protein